MEKINRDYKRWIWIEAELFNMHKLWLSSFKWKVGAWGIQGLPLCLASLHLEYLPQPSHKSHQHWLDQWKEKKKGGVGEGLTTTTTKWLRTANRISTTKLLKNSKLQPYMWRSCNLPREPALARLTADWKSLLHCRCVFVVVNFVKLLYLTKFDNAKNNGCEFSRIFRTNVDKSLIIFIHIPNLKTRISLLNRSYWKFQSSCIVLIMHVINGVR